MYSSLVCGEMVFKAILSHIEDDHNGLFKWNFNANLFLLVIVTTCSFVPALEHFTPSVVTEQLFLNCALPKWLELKIIFQKRDIFKEDGRGDTEKQGQEQSCLR